LAEKLKIATVNSVTVVDVSVSGKSIIQKYWLLFSELSKFRITGFVALSSAFGYIIFSHTLSFELLINSIGVLFLASGSAAFNHLQEWKFDKLMSRTKDRPIPSGKLSVASTFLFSTVFTLTGLLLIYLSSNITALIIGVITLVWYNLIYTPLKRVTAISVIPGALIGALPPIIGFTAAGGSPFETKILIVALFLFLWQAPHFWLLLLIHDKDYKKAGFPSLTDSFTKKEVKIFTILGICAMVLNSFLIPFFSSSEPIVSGSIILILGLWVLYKITNLLKNTTTVSNFRKAFMNLNIYVLVIVFVISIEHLIL